VTDPVAVGQMIGEVSREGLVRKERLAVGDQLLLTKALAVEAVSIIARERPDEVRAAHGEAFLERATGFLRDPGISVVNEALAACSAGGPELHAMHDPTEGGLSGGLYELAAASGKGLRIERERIPVYSEAEALCQQFGMDPLGVIASGSLLLAAEAGAAERIGEALRQQGVTCTQIGEVVAGEGYMCTYADGTELPRFRTDEITKLF
jgi:hydrogenase maturation factor